MSDQKKQNDLMEFVDEKSPGGNTPIKKSVQQNGAWRILITDDEQDVHSATTFALRNTRILGRRLEFLHASSAKETVKILKENNDIAVIILDVVMETPNAGLDLVAVIRQELKITDSRIILRTGQPNQAPEIEVIRDYDINDYKLKSELTQTKLYAALTTAVRSYKQIRMIDAGKKSLGMIVRSSAELLSKEGLNSFAEGVIVHLAGLLSVAPEGLICVRRDNDDQEGGDLTIIAAAGRYQNLINRPLSDLDEMEAKELLAASLECKYNQFDSQGVALYLGSDARGDMGCYVASSQKIDDLDASLLELFCSNIRICADNLTLLERLRNFAYQDQLVSLPNRISLTETIDEAITNHKAADYILAILDIDDFSDINASLGQKYGDSLLIAIAERLRNAFSENVSVARVEGDAFAIFGPVSEISDNKILGPFKTPFKISSDEQLITITAGTIHLNEGFTSGQETLKDASIALKAAKNRFRGEVQKFSRHMVEEARARLNLLHSVRAAFEMERLYLAYQPKVCLKNDKVTGFEALVRWKNEEGTIIPPEQFIPLAEKSGFIIKLGEWIIRTSFLMLSKLQKLGYTGLDMAINVSVAQFRHADLLTILTNAVKEYGISPSMIDLEITESIAMDDVNANMETLKSIKSLGFKLSVDDFGTGFSSLSYLQRLPIDHLKIDKAFVIKSDTSAGKDITQMIVNLGRTLDLKLIAEGVQTEEQKALMTDLGCDEAQGFLMARPMEESSLIKWLEIQKQLGKL